MLALLALAEWSHAQSLTMTDALVVDANGNGIAEDGDVIELTAVNTPPILLATPEFEWDPTANLSLVVGSVSAISTITPAPVINSGNTGGDTTVRVAIDAGTPLIDVTTITFRAVVGGLASGTTSIATQSEVVDPLIIALGLSDDPDQPGASDPTEIPVNTPPVPFDDVISVPEGGLALVPGGPNLLVNDIDPPNTSTTLSAVSTGLTSNLGTTVLISADGRFRYLSYTNFDLFGPNTGATTDSFAYTVVDNNGATATATAQIVVQHTTTTYDATFGYTLVDELLLDNNSNGLADNGDVIRFQVSSVQPTPIFISFDRFYWESTANLALNAGSVTTDESIIRGNTAGDTDVIVYNALTRIPGQVTTFTFTATVQNLTVGTTSIATQGRMNVFNTPGFASYSDDPDVPGAFNPTVIAAAGPPAPTTLVMTDALVVDANSNGVAEDGDVVELTAFYTQTVPLSEPDFEWNPTANLTLIPGSVTVASSVPVAITSGNGAADTTVGVAIGSGLVNVDQTTITFRVVVGALAPGTTTVLTQSTAVDGLLGVTELSDDPDFLGATDPTVIPVNTPPVAVDDFYATSEDSNFNVGLPGLLGNDSDPPNSTPTLSVAAGSFVSALGADVTLLADGRFFYDPRNAAALQAPDSGATTDSFIYTLIDSNGLTSAATVTLIVSHTPDPLDATKSAVLNDLDFDGFADPGEQIDYTIVIENTGTSKAGIVFFDTPDANTTLLIPVTTSQGTIIEGDTAGDTAVEIAVGTIAPYDIIVINVSVTVNASLLPTRVTELSNQGRVEGTSVTTFLTDDPATVAPDDPTILPADPQPDAFPDFYTTDEDNVFNVSVTSGVLANDIDSPNTSGSLTVSAFDPISALGAPVTVQVDGSLTWNPAGVAAIQSLVAGQITTDTFAYTVSDNNGNASVTTVSITVIGYDEMRATKRVSIVADADADGYGDAGDTLLYTLEIFNDGATTATNVALIDIPDPLTSMQNGSVVTSAGVVTIGNGGGDTTVRVDIPRLPPFGASVEIEYTTVVDTPIPLRSTVITNQGGISSDNFDPVVTDNPLTLAVDDPTTVGADPGPIANDDNVKTDEDTIIAFVVLDNDTDDPPNSSATLAIDSVDPVSLLGSPLTIVGQDIVYDPTVNPTLQALPQGASTSDSFNYVMRDNNGNTAAARVDVSVIGVNDNPTAVLIDNNTIPERVPAQFIGNLSTLDVDTGDTHTYALVGGVTDNNSFEILNGNELHSTVEFDYPVQLLYRVRVRVTDTYGGTYVETLFIRITQNYTISWITGGDHPYDILVDPEDYLRFSDITTGTVAPSSYFLEIGDDQYAEFPLGFDFFYFGEIYDTVRVSGNGFVLFGNVEDQFWINGANERGTHPEDNSGLIHSNYAQRVLAFAWDDWDVSDYVSYNEGGIFIGYLEDTPHGRVFVVQYDNFLRLDGDNPDSVQLLITEERGDVIINIDDLDSPHRNGMAIGMQQSQSTYIQYGFDSAPGPSVGWPQNNRQLLIRQGPIPTLSSPDVPDGGVTGLTTVTFQIEFDIPVELMHPDDIFVSVGAVSSFNEVSSTVYRFTVVQTVAPQGPIQVQVMDGVALNQGQRSQESNLYTYNYRQGAISPLITAGAPRDGQTSATLVRFDVEFTTDVVGFDQSDLIVINGSPAGFTRLTSNTFTFFVLPQSSGLVSVEIPAGAANGLRPPFPPTEASIVYAFTYAPSRASLEARRLQALRSRHWELYR